MTAAAAPARDAVLDATATYRYRLDRAWPSGKGAVCFIMLNPSTADAKRDDPTIRRCVWFAWYWGYSRLIVVNLYAYRATSPRDLRGAVNPIGSENDRYIIEAAREAERVVVAWGALDPRRLEHFRAAGVLFDGALRDVRPLYCLGKTKNGSPRHPLYVKGETAMEVFV